MKLTRRYQLIADRAVCMSYGCPWHRDGGDAEATGAAHAQATGHEVRVTASAVVIFNGTPPGRTGGPDTPDRQAARRAVLAGGTR